MAEVLFAPDAEEIVTRNVWAFLHWLRTTRGVHLKDWEALQRWSAENTGAFCETVTEFADCGTAPLPLDPSRTGRREERELAEFLLHADIRPDDRLLVQGPWIVQPDVSISPASLFVATAERHASILVAPALILAEAAFQRSRHPDLSALRTIIATGGPMSPEARRRIYTWVKADVMLLARNGGTFWGNPLEPVLARPHAMPAFLMPRPSARGPR